MVFVRKLTKVEVERMLNTYDEDPVGTLTLAISLTSEVASQSWTDLVGNLGFDIHRTQSLRERDTEALDELLKSLVENRSL